jgi:hypothetical protein
MNILKHICMYVLESGGRVPSILNIYTILRRKFGSTPEERVHWSTVGRRLGGTRARLDSVSFGLVIRFTELL